MKLTFRAALVAACVLLIGATPAFAAPGNNGTVKIDGVAFDQHPNNEPHVGCVFEVDFYGYDEGDLEATASFKLHPPTGTSHLVTRTADIGEDPAGGGTDLDAEIEVDLQPYLIASGAVPHPIQGFHVKLTVNAEGSIGADVKHKVFWVECEGVYPPRVDEQQETVEGSGLELAATGVLEDPSGPTATAFGFALAVAGLAGAALLMVRRRLLGVRSHR